MPGYRRREFIQPRFLWLGALVLIALIGVVLYGCYNDKAQAQSSGAPTQVWGLYGWGDNWRGTSSGIDDIANVVRTIPGVEFVHIFNYYQTQEVYNEIMAAPPDRKIAIYGYSCGNNALPVIATGLNGHHAVDVMAGIQMSLWCGGNDVSPNVVYAQTTYGECGQTLGLGCKKFKAAPGNASSMILNISRPERHGTADNDPDYQMDVISAIQETAMAPPPTAPGSDIMLPFGHGHALARRGFANMIKGAAMFKRGAHEVVCHHDPSGDQCQPAGE